MSADAPLPAGAPHLVDAVAVEVDRRQGRLAGRRRAGRGRRRRGRRSSSVAVDRGGGRRRRRDRPRRRRRRCTLRHRSTTTTRSSRRTRRESAPSAANVPCHASCRPRPRAPPRRLGVARGAGGRPPDGAGVGLPRHGGRRSASATRSCAPPATGRSRRCSSTRATTPGTNPDAGYIRRFVEDDGGYAYIGVNLRGTGCSEGTFDFFQPQEAVDGAAVVEWIADQPWSERPGRHDRQELPGHHPAVRRRPAARAPGGDRAGPLLRRRLPRRRPPRRHRQHRVLLAVELRRPAQLRVPVEPRRGRGRRRRLPPRIDRGGRPASPTNPFVQLLQHEWDDDLVRERSPITYLDDIDVPMLATLAWQDEQLASRQTHLLAAAGRPRFDQLVGDAHQRRPRHVADGDRARRPRAVLRPLPQGRGQRLGGPAAGPGVVGGRPRRRRPRARAGSPGSTTGRSRSARRVGPWSLHLRAGGGLTGDAGGAGEADDARTPYAPVVGSQGVGNPRVRLRRAPVRLPVAHAAARPAPRPPSRPSRSPRTARCSARRRSTCGWRRRRRPRSTCR